MEHIFGKSYCGFFSERKIRPRKYICFIYVSGFVPYPHYPFLEGTFVKIPINSLKSKDFISMNPEPDDEDTLNLKIELIMNAIKRRMPIEKEHINKIYINWLEEMIQCLQELDKLYATQKV